MHSRASIEAIQSGDADLMIAILTLLQIATLQHGLRTSGRSIVH